MFLDMAASELILEKVREDRYAQNLYAAMCNMQWQKTQMWPILTNELWSVSWRRSGGLIADLRSEGDYIDWYCSGIRNTTDDEALNSVWDKLGYVPEGLVTDEIREDLANLGWHPVPWDDD